MSPPRDREDKSAPSDGEIAAALDGLPGWRREGIFLKKSFRFENFREINAFLPHCAETIVRLNHHPDLDFRPAEKRMDISTSTHATGGISRADLSLARALEEWPRP